MNNPNQTLNEAEKLAVWSSYASISRSWVQIIDTKAAFITALNLGLLTALWSGSTITEKCLPAYIKWLGLATTIVSIISIFFSLWAVLPRDSLTKVFSKNTQWSSDYHPISFYGYIARKFSIEKFKDFHTIANSLSEADLVSEALEQHFIISHTALVKSKWVEWSGYFLIIAFSCAALTFGLRLFE